jgi:hypothetical protein
MKKNQMWEVSYKGKFIKYAKNTDDFRNTIIKLVESGFKVTPVNTKFEASND